MSILSSANSPVDASNSSNHYYYHTNNSSSTSRSATTATLISSTSPYMSSPASSLTTSSSKAAHECISSSQEQLVEDDVNNDDHDIVNNDTTTGALLSNERKNNVVFHVQNFKSSLCSKHNHDDHHSNWLCCDDIIRKSNNKGFFPCDLSENHIISKKHIIRSSLSSSSLDVFGRWFLLKFAPKCRSGSICDLFIVRNKCHTLMENFKNLLLSCTKSNITNNNYLSRYDDDDDCDADNSAPSVRFLLAKWPSDEVISRERAKILDEIPFLSSTSSKQQQQQQLQHNHEDDYLGMSASALQEMQLLYQLHRQVPSSPRGHNNFLLPLSILINKSASSSDTTATTKKINNVDEGNYLNNNHLDLVGGNFTRNERSFKEKLVSPGSYLVYEPVSMCLQQVIAHLKKGTDCINSNAFNRNNNRHFPKTLFKCWFYDLLCALDHCHTNNIVLRSFSADQIFLDHSRMIKFGGLNKAMIIPIEERTSCFDNIDGNNSGIDDNNVYTEHPNHNMKKHGKALISEVDVSNPYIAPELLLGISKYSKQSDIFTLASIICHFLLQKPLFSGKDRKSRLTAMFKIIGSPSEENCSIATKSPSYKEMFSNKSSTTSKIYKPGVIKALKFFIKDDDNRKGCTEEIMQILDRMLHLDPKKRISANQALRMFISKCDFDPQVISQSKEYRMDFVTEWIHLKHSMSSLSSSNDENKKLLSSSSPISFSEHKRKGKRNHNNKSYGSQENDDELYMF